MGRFLPAIMIMILLAGGCGDGGAAPDTGQPQVVVTTTMIGDLVKNIAGQRVQLKVVMGPGVNPHTYNPTTSDIAAMANADLVLYNGLHLEGTLADTLETGLPKAVAVTRDMPREQLLPWSDGSKAFDPHVWMAPKLWAHTARTTAAALAKIDPKNADHYLAAGDKHAAEIEAIHDEVARRITTIPPDQRVLITSHDAYNYFGKAFGVEVRGLQGISTESEAGLASLTDAVEFILARQIKAIFIESSVSPKTIQRVQADLRSRGKDVAIGGELYSDAMGAPGDHPGYEVETYRGMMLYNTDTIVNALK